MPEFFVWFSPFLIEVVEAETAQDAAEQFLDLPVTVLPEPGSPPDCYVQAKKRQAAPNMEGHIIPFWSLRKLRKPVPPPPFERVQ